LVLRFDSNRWVFAGYSSTVTRSLAPVAYVFSLKSTIDALSTSG
jgi:hypothetical protein